MNRDRLPHDAPWSVPLERLATLRTAPIAASAFEAWLARLEPDRATLLLELTLHVRWPQRTALVVHRGDPAALVGEGWLALLGLHRGRLVVECVDTVGERCRWASARLRPGWHRVAVVLQRHADGRLTPAGGALDGRALAASEALPWRDVHGEFDDAPTLTIGGLRDRAGGHTDLRFGERRGELVTRLAAWSYVRGGVLATSPSRPRTMASASAGADADSVRGSVLRLWDHGGRVEVAPVPTPSQALVHGPVEGFELAIDGRGRRLRAPRRRTRSMSIPVFAPGDAGYAAFRIPALVRAADGTLLAFAEGRQESVSDTCPTKDLVIRRSDDGGRTWSTLQVAARAPDVGVARSLMNPSPVVDARTGDVVLVASWLPTDEWTLARDGGRGRLLAWRSDDHGRSWQGLLDVSAQLDQPVGLDAAWPDPGPWRLQVGTLGHAVQLRQGPHAGRLCYVGHGTFGPASVFDATGYLFWSDDGGRRWSVGPVLARRADGGSARGWNESTLAELDDGRLLLNARQYRNGRPVGYRGRAWVDWDAHGVAQVGPVEDDPELVDSGVQASLVALADGRLGFCNPAHPRARYDLTLRVSTDGGRSWPSARVLVEGRVGYSDLVALDAETVGVLYEHGLDGAIDVLVVTLP